MDTKFIVVTGGVISGVGKGVITASLGKIIKEYGYKTTLIKIDPYINCDAGTLRPTEHGEVWVTEDGGEIDQDLGTYERFLQVPIPKKNNITTGQVFKAVIDKERAGGYLGKTVQLVPHVTDHILERIYQAAEGHEVAIIEIGGTLGDYENLPFLFSIKALERELGAHNVANVLVAFLPVPSHINEMKTKPTQLAIRLLGEQGLHPDFIVCRSHEALDQVRKKKIEVFAHIRSDHIIAAPDLADSIYQMPLILEEQRVGQKMLEHLQLSERATPDWTEWERRITHIASPACRLRIGVVGKYLSSGAHCMSDSYLSICHALLNAGAESNAGVDIVWINAAELTDQAACADVLASLDGLIVAGGFGESGVNGKLQATQYAREQGIPFLGICYGMHLAAAEYARSVCDLAGAHTTEVDEQTPHPVITILPLQKKLLEECQYGGTMRLGGYQAFLKPNSIIEQLYKKAGRGEASVHADQSYWSVRERHRHRYEVNPDYVPKLEKAGFIFSGFHARVDGTMLMEFAEIPSHRFFVATQAHPEFTSTFGDPNPLFYGLVLCAQEYQAERGTGFVASPEPAASTSESKGRAAA